MRFGAAVCWTVQPLLRHLVLLVVPSLAVKAMGRSEDWRRRGATAFALLGVAGCSVGACFELAPGHCTLIVIAGCVGAVTVRYA